MTPVVLLTDPIDPAGVERLRPHAEVRIASATDAATLRREVRDADVMIVRAPLPGDLVDHAPRLLGCVRHGAGVEPIPLAACTAAGVVVADVPDANAPTVAEFAIAQCLLHARGLARIDRMVRDGHWAAAHAQSVHMVEMTGCTLGIVGVGAVGSRLAAIAGAFGMRVLGHRGRAGAMVPAVEPVPLDRLFADSDFVVLCCPLTDETRHLVDARRLALMKRGALLVNVAHGAVVDQAALVDALRERRIAGAALDVFEQQPLPAGDPLLQLDHVVLSPHLAGRSVQSMRRTSCAAADEALRILSGEWPLHTVNPEIGARRRPAAARVGRDD